MPWRAEKSDGGALCIFPAVRGQNSCFLRIADDSRIFDVAMAAAVLMGRPRLFRWSRRSAQKERERRPRASAPLVLVGQAPVATAPSGMLPQAAAGMHEPDGQTSAHCCVSKKPSHSVHFLALIE